VTGVMVQFGNVATGHVWAPEDIQADIDSKADQTLTQEQLNALEAKRLQMETEMKALATLQQVSELETFINNLKKEDLDGRQKIIEITKAIEERVKDIEPIMEYSQKLKFMDTYITQGNGGMVIGANESTTKVVVTPDRISFQSGGSEVAYISQRMLHIDNGVFTMSLQLGHYITRAHPKNEYVNATYFVK
ncbi:antireceptor, partial [Streptococcus lutetiensis]|nr:antireceptor [Streptococcus lutetiensis]